jgi:hypothetical protein
MRDKPRKQAHTGNVTAPFNPTQLGDLGRKLYTETFEPIYAPSHIGEILAIEVKSKTAYLGKTPLEALQTAQAAQPNGFFHLVRIGSPGVYKLSRPIR